MAQKKYYIDGIEHFKLVVSRRGKNGRPIRRKAKCDQHGRLITSQKVADRIENKLRKEVNYLYNKSNTLTWNSWHKNCLEKIKLQYKEGTAIGYEKGLTKWLPKDWHEKELTQLTKDDVFELIFRCIGEREDSTKNIQKAVLQKIKRIFEMAVEEGILDKNPATGITVKVPCPEQKVLNSNEANTLLQAGEDCNHRYYYHWAFALFTGLRNGELYALRWPDIDFCTGLISVTKQWTSKDGLHETKGNRNRVVPISPEFKKILINLKNKRPFKGNLPPGKKEIKKYPIGDPRREGEIFNDLALPHYIDWKNGEQAKVLAAFCKNLGITEIKFHDLRATFITNLLSNGVPLVKVMAIAGHAEMSVTNKYLRLAGVDIKHGTTEKLAYYAPNHVSKTNVVPIFK